MWAPMMTPIEAGSPTMMYARCLTGGVGSHSMLPHTFPALVTVKAKIETHNADVHTKILAVLGSLARLRQGWGLCLLVLLRTPPAA